MKIGWLTKPPKPNLSHKDCYMTADMKSVFSRNANITATVCVCMMHILNGDPTRNTNINSEEGFLIDPFKKSEQFTKMWKYFKQHVKFYTGEDNKQDMCWQNLDEIHTTLEISPRKLFVQLADQTCLCVSSTWLAAKLLHLHLYKTNMVHKLSNTVYEARQNILRQYSATTKGISECVDYSQHTEFLTWRTCHYSTPFH